MYWKLIRYSSLRWTVDWHGYQVNGSKNGKIWIDYQDDITLVHLNIRGGEEKEQLKKFYCKMYSIWRAQSSDANDKFPICNWGDFLAEWKYNFCANYHCFWGRIVIQISHYNINSGNNKFKHNIIWRILMVGAGNVGSILLCRRNFLQRNYKWGRLLDIKEGFAEGKYRYHAM
jgi:hypothetical protein